MKNILITILIITAAASGAFANDKCLSQAIEEAKLYVANGNAEEAALLTVEDSFFHSSEAGVLYYGILLSDERAVNVGVDENTCELRHINTVTDEI